MARAAILHSRRSALRVEDIEVAEPGPGEVLVKVAYSAVCEHDLALIAGLRQASLPVIPGHGGSAVVLQVGTGVTGVDAGDHVLLCGPTGCGRCYWCLRKEAWLCPVGRSAVEAGTMLDGTTRVHAGGRAIRQWQALGTFAGMTVVPESSVLPVHASIDLKTAALVDCGVLVGVGAATRAASIGPGDTVVVIGNGSVGLNAIQGARFGGAGAIVVMGSDVGLLEEDLGATHLVNGSGEESSDLVAELTEGRGADVVIETEGTDDSIRLAVACSRSGGVVVLTTAPRTDVSVAFDSRGDLIGPSRTIKGARDGAARPREDVPVLLELQDSGMLRLDRPDLQILPLDQVNEAVSMLQSGTTRQVLLAHC